MNKETLLDWIASKHLEVAKTEAELKVAFKIEELMKKWFEEQMKELEEDREKRTEVYDESESKVDIAYSEKMITEDNAILDWLERKIPVRN